MAEISRQVGTRLPRQPVPKRWAPVYDRAFEMVSEMAGEDLWLEDLLDY